MMQRVSIEDCHNMYYGAADSCDAAKYVGVGPRVARTLQTYTEVIPPHTRRPIHLKAHDGETGFANIQFGGSWVSADFAVGIDPYVSHCLERNWRVSDDNGFWLTQNGRAFPALLAESCFVFVEAGDEEATVSWDGVEICQFSPDHWMEIYAIDRQFAGAETLTQKSYTMELDAGHPVFSLHARTNRLVKGMYITINDRLLDAPFVWAGDHWELVFQEIPEDGMPRSSAKTINFSRLDKVELYVEHDCDAVDVVVWATNTQIIRIANGMAAYAYTK